MKLKSIEEKISTITGYYEVNTGIEVHEEIMDGLNQYRQHLIQTIRKEVEGYKSEAEPEDGEEEVYKSAYWQALSDILTYLTTLEEEVSK